MSCVALAPTQDAKVRSLVRQAKNGKPAALSTLVLLYQPIAAALARNYDERVIAREDALSVCTEAFVASFVSYDPSRCPLASYWHAKAKFALGDYYRDQQRVGQDNGQLAAAYCSELREHGKVDVASFASKHGIGRARALRVAMTAVCPVSLDAPLRDNSLTPAGEQLVMDSSSPADQAMDENDREWLRDGLGGLPAREREILVRYYGLDDRTPESDGAIGASIGLSQQRVYQLRSSALNALKMRFATAN